MGIWIIACAVVISTAFCLLMCAYDIWHYADVIERQNALLQESEGE
jgi:hypothetical protein